jgi:hypothetical protein
VEAGAFAGCAGDDAAGASGAIADCVTGAASAGAMASGEVTVVISADGLSALGRAAGCSSKAFAVIAKESETKLAKVNRAARGVMGGDRQQLGFHQIPRII